MILKKLVSAVIKRTIQGAISYLSAPSVAGVLSSWGVTTDTGTVTISLFAVVEALRNYLKHSKGVRWL